MEPHQWKHVVRAAAEEVKIRPWTKDRTARATYARWLAAYTLRENVGASLMQIRDALQIKAHSSVQAGLVAFDLAILDGDTFIKIGRETFSGSLKEAAQRVWTKATIRAATERQAA
jgi:hypothetical protein